MTEPAAATPDELCRRIHPRLVGSLQLYLGDRETAAELAQDALVRTVERWSQVQRMDHPEAWVYRVAFNLARSGLRRRAAEHRAMRRAGGRARDAHASDASDASPTVPDQADALAVRAAVRALAPRQRQAVVLRFYGDLSVGQIAEAMGCRPGTVKAHLHQAIAALRSAGLADDGDEVVADDRDVATPPRPSTDDPEIPR